MDLLSLSLAEVAGHIRRRELSAFVYATHLLEHIENDQLRAFITVSPEAVLAAAKQADETSPVGPLHGVPIAIKDNIDTADLPTTGGTPALRHHRPRKDAAVVEALRSAGALVLGKTNLHELAYGVTGANGAFGAARNPHDPSRIAGGSSSGSAAAVYAGLAPGALGTDTGGSVRIPAALCGIVGLRPTSGRYPQDGIMLVSTTRDTAGPLARTVADVAVLDAAITGAEPLSEMDLRGLRMGVVRDPFYVDAAPGVAAVMENHLAQLESLGVELVEVQLPDGFAELMVGAGFPIAFHETPLTLQNYLGAEQELADVVEQCASPDVKQILQMILGEGRIPLSDYEAAMTVHRPALESVFRERVRTHRLTAFIAPTTPVTAAPLGAEEVELGGETVSAFAAYTRTTGPGSAIGWPGLTVPGGLDESGLPVGVALDGPPGSDRVLLRIGQALERAFG
ncbi:indoleacetamide hydrolase [Allokutzneria sp. A3M-2-11 16]|uniref:indoleacetamide hydrolase n=1 Tax=Allokutzneria sp. A3M-2-11 16 TaxID=2962043 RepID=UPI0020B813A5|nr:indoleacetamide hydrolase [Allokutzneria sp. A3M-2-11 16]MCP3800649.1 indoleacetamide hydrolase [Allokutzneria sp. A3M-2-11 16]